MLESKLEDKEEMNIHVMRWIIMLIHDYHENDDKMIRSLDEWWDKSQPSLCKGHYKYSPNRVLNIKNKSYSYSIYKCKDNLHLILMMRREII